MEKYSSLSGTVVNATNSSQLIPGALVFLSQRGVRKYYATTDLSGAYLIPSIVPGLYDVSVSRARYATDSTTNYDLSVGGVNKTFNVNLTYVIPAYLNGTVTNSAGALKGVLISATSQTGLPCALQPLTPTAFTQCLFPKAWSA